MHLIHLHPRGAHRCTWLCHILPPIRSNRTTHEGVFRCSGRQRKRGKRVEVPCVCVCVLELNRKQPSNTLANGRKNTDREGVYTQQGDNFTICSAAALPWLQHHRIRTHKRKFPVCVCCFKRCEAYSSFPLIAALFPFPPPPIAAPGATALLHCGLARNGSMQVRYGLLLHSM